MAPTIKDRQSAVYSLQKDNYSARVIGALFLYFGFLSGAAGGLSMLLTGPAWRWNGGHMIGQAGHMQYAVKDADKNCTIASGSEDCTGSGERSVEEIRESRAWAQLTIDVLSFFDVKDLQEKKKEDFEEGDGKNLAAITTLIKTNKIDEGMKSYGGVCKSTILKDDEDIKKYCDDLEKLVTLGWAQQGMYFQAVFYLSQILLASSYSEKLTLTIQVGSSSIIYIVCIGVHAGQLAAYQQLYDDVDAAKLKIYNKLLNQQTEKIGVIASAENTGFETKIGGWGSGAEANLRMIKLSLGFQLLSQSQYGLGAQLQDDNKQQDENKQNLVDSTKEQSDENQAQDKSLEIQDKA